MDAQTIATTTQPPSMDAEHQVFISYARADGELVNALEKMLCANELSVWKDTEKIEEFDGISDSIIDGIARSKLFVIWYSPVYATRPACQWELLSALTAASSSNGDFARIIAINPCNTFEHIQPTQLRDLQNQLARNSDPAGMEKIAQLVRARAFDITGPIGRSSVSQPRERVRGKPGLASSSSFVGRVPQLFEIHGKLWADKHPITTDSYLRRAVLIIGLAGTGKSFLAEEYAARFGGVYRGGIYWLTASSLEEKQSYSREGLRRQRNKLLSELATRLEGIHDVGKRDPLDTIVKHLDAIACPYLWVVDDFPQEASGIELREWCAPTIQGRTLFTSRDAGNRLMADAIELGGLAPAAAQQLLPRPTSLAEARAADEICRMLGYHPLAITIANGAVSKRSSKTAYRSYLNDLNTNVVGELQASRELVGTLPNDYKRNIVTSLLLTVDRCSAKARTLLQIAAAFSPALIPTRALIRTLSAVKQLDWSESRRKVEAGLAELQSASILKLRGSDSVEIHALIQRILQIARFRPKQLRKVEEHLEKILIRDLACAPEPSRREELDELLPHAEYLKGHNTPNKPILDAYVGQLYAQRGATELALDNLQIAYRYTSTLNESNQFDRFVTRAYAEQLTTSGRSAEAEPLYAKLLNAARRSQGEGHPATLSMLTGYIRALAANQEYDEAARWAVEAINLYSKNPTLATRIRLAGIRSVLADILLAGGELSEAFLHMRSATQELYELTFEGNLERSRVRLTCAQILLRMGLIDRSPGMPGALDEGQMVLQEVARTWGLTHPLAIEAGVFVAGCADTLGLNEDAMQLRWALLAMAQADPTPNPTIAKLLKEVAGSRRPADAVIEQQIRFLEELVAMPSFDRIDETFGERSGEEFGNDSILVLIAKGNQVLGAANKILSEGDLALGIKTLLELVKHYERNRSRGSEDTKYLFVLRELGNALLASGDYWWAWAIHERLFEYWLSAEGDRSSKTVMASLQLIETLRAAREYALARRLLKRYVLWVLGKNKAERTPELIQLTPIIVRLKRELDSPVSFLTSCGPQKSDGPI